jgi:hypothetical protein
MARITNHISEVRIAARQILNALEELRALKLEADARNWGAKDFTADIEAGNGNADIAGGDVNAVHTKTTDMIAWSEATGQWLKALYKLKV